MILRKMSEVFSNNIHDEFSADEDEDAQYVEKFNELLHGTLNVTAVQALSFLFEDVKYVLNARDVAPFVVNSDLLDELMRVPAALQFSDPYLRKKGSHVQYEAEGYQASLVLCASFMDSFEALLVRDNLILGKLFRTSLDAALAWVAGTKGQQVARSKLNFVSFNIPLHRCVALSAVAALSNGISLDQLFGNNSASTLRKLITEPLRIMRNRAQLIAGMWNRNGNALYNYLINYHSPKLGRAMISLDIAMLQLAAIAMGPDMLITCMLEQFDLSEFWVERPVMPSMFGLSEWLVVATQFVALLLWIATDREYLLNSDQHEAMLRRAIVNRLVCAKKGLTYSKLKSSIPTVWSKNEKFASTLKDVAAFRGPSVNQASVGSDGVFVFEQRWKSFYDAFYPLVNRYDAEQAAEQISENKDFVPPQKPLELLPQCSALLSVYSSNAVAEIVFYSLYHIKANGAKVEHHALLSAVLRLIEMSISEAKALNEAGREDWNTALVDLLSARCGAAMPLVLLKSISESNNEQRARILWILREMRGLSSEANAAIEKHELLPKEEAQQARPTKSLAAQRQQMLMQQFQAQQAAFMQHSELSDDEDGVSEEEQELCILCREPHDNAKPLCGLAYTMNSNLKPNQKARIAKFCGHTAHAECWQQYAISPAARQSNATVLMIQARLCSGLCPLCRAPTNALAPRGSVGAVAFAESLAIDEQAPYEAMIRGFEQSVAWYELCARSPGNTPLFDAKNVASVRWLSQCAASLPSPAPPAFAALDATPLSSLLRFGINSSVELCYATAVAQACIALQIPLEIEQASERSEVAELCVPFLKQAALLRAVSASNDVPYLPDSPLECAQLLKRFLSIGKFSKSTLDRIDKAREALGGTQAYREDPAPFALIKLPGLLEELLLSTRGKTCNNCGTVPEEPALCLRCGELVCAASSCCKVGSARECSLHSQSCSAGNGVFLLMRRAGIIFTHRGLGVIQSSPYLNEFGEERMSLSRHNKLMLNEARAEQLERTFLNHAIVSALAGAQQNTPIDFF